MDEAVDVIVVGGGSAGAAVASRLSEQLDTSVLLLEAGTMARRPEVSVPAAFSRLYRSDVDWSYDTEPQPHLAGRTIYWPRGKMIGGSSSMNAMMWVRGYAADYDAWAKVAGPEWAYDALLPLFRRIEAVAGPAHADYGRAGAIRIEHQRSPRSHTERFLAAVDEAGLGRADGDADPAQPDGFRQTLVTEQRGSRYSAARGYLAPARNRSNLTVRCQAHVTKVLFDGRRASGVEYQSIGEPRVARARRQIVLCGGTVNTPQLLMLSGIGPSAELRRHGIDVQVDAPEVGRNLTDHLVSGLIRRVPNDTLFSADRPRQLVDYLVRRRGMLTSNVAEAYGFVRSRPDLALPDLELIFAPVAFVAEGLTPPPAHSVTIGAIVLQPASRGTITLESADPFGKPVIDPAYLSDPDGADRAVLTHGLELVDQLFATSAFAGVVGDYLVPEHAEDMSPAERYRIAIDEFAHAIYHPVGTCRMGSDESAVVDPRLRVRGVDGLMVADASVMPAIIRGHTNAPAILIGERAAELVLS